MGKPPTTDQELQARVAALEARADATDAAITSLHADLDVTNADVSMLIDRTDALDDRVTALEEGVPLPPEPTDPPVISGGPIIPPDRPDHTLPVPEPQPPEPPTTGRAAIITLDGASHVFTQEGGTDLGAYTDPQGRFVQHCIAARCDTLPDFTVFFRPDADGGREEVVFEFGRCHGNPAGSTLGAYTAEITLDGETLYSTATDPRLTTATPPVQQPNGTIWWHPYYTRWRWQSAPRPVTRTAAELVAANLVPNYDPALAPFQWSQPPAVPRPVYTDGGPMTLSWAGEPFNSDLFGPNGIPPNMTQTGDGWSLGILPEPVADYVMYEDAQGLTNIRAWLEGSGCFSWILRDENTYAPIDFVNTYPSANISNWGNPRLPYYGDYQIPWLQMIVSCSHEADLAYLIFQLTGDPYALEQMQFQTTQGYCYNPSPDDFNLAQAVRAYAWHLRDLAHTVVSTPDSVPSWLQPEEYWQTYLDRAKAFAIANGPDSGIEYKTRFFVMKNFLQGGGVSGYMEEFCCAVYQHMALLKLPGWDELADWMIQGIIARSNGTSGWNRSKPVAYDYGLSVNFDSVTICPDWAAAWNENVRLLPAEYAPPDWSDPTQTHLAAQGDINYWQVGEAALAMAKRRGVNVDTSWLVPEMHGRRPGRRWAISA